jgi:hypothetical protein
MIDAGTLPRSLTVKPFARAQARTSVLLGASAGRPALALGDLRLPALVRPDRVRAFLPAGVRFRGVDVRCRVGAVSSVPSLATTRLTPYTAPTTRNTSARGSVESIVTFNAIPSQMAPLLTMQRRAEATLQARRHPRPREATKSGPYLRLRVAPSCAPRTAADPGQGHRARPVQWDN